MEPHRHVSTRCLFFVVSVIHCNSVKLYAHSCARCVFAVVEYSGYLSEESVQRSKVHSKNDKVMTRAADKQERWVGKTDSPTPRERYGFVEFKNEEDADYAIKIMNMIRNNSARSNYFCLVFFDIKVDGYEVNLRESNTTL